MNVRLPQEATVLPAYEIIPPLRQSLNTEKTILISAPPGAGKSTVIPLGLIDIVASQKKKIIMLEPRRLAAKAVAARMADLLGEKLGERIGYRIRFESVVSDKTIIEVVTEGILTRMLQEDNELQNVAIVIFDEFHERSIHADLALALCRQSQLVLRPDLNIIIMSATLNLGQLKTKLNCPVLQAEGRLYPVTIHYEGECDLSVLPDLTARLVNKAFKEHTGDILVFLPGQSEILQVEERLKKQHFDVRIHTLFGILPFNQQYAAIMPDKNGRRKIVLATNIAETSLTIEGVSVVIDSGYVRKSVFDLSDGLSRLETVRITADAADQRAGRAGRLGPGVCYRMWSAATQHKLIPHRVPELLEADLTGLLLEFAMWGGTQINDYQWIDLPSEGSVNYAAETLEQLGALAGGKVTEIGRKMAKLPCHPRIAHMLLSAQDDAEMALACDLAALLEERDPLPEEKNIDINLRIEKLRYFREDRRLAGRWLQIEKNASAYRRLLNVEEANDSYDPYQCGFLLSQAFPERIASSRPGNNAQFQLANGAIAMAGHQDSLAHEPWLSIAHVHLNDKAGKIHLAAPLNPRDLAQLVKELTQVKWDNRNKELVASKDLKIGSIILKSTPINRPPDDVWKPIISHELKRNGIQLLNFTEKDQQWINRVISYKKWSNSSDWPDFTINSLLNDIDQWLIPYLEWPINESTLHQLKLSDLLKNILPYEEQLKLDQMLPEKLQVPTGSLIDIVYFEDGKQPEISVRLQEVFGMARTPTLLEGKVTIVLKLLSPGFKPVQVTSDLVSFWNNTYPFVKKELQRKYPKHSWPEDPWNAQPIRGAVKRNS